MAADLHVAVQHGKLAAVVLPLAEAGKRGLGDIGTEGAPWKQGFDEFFGYLHQAHAHFYYPPYLDNRETRLKNHGPFRGNKTTMYEGGLRVPMLVRWPGKVAAGKGSGLPWMFVDAMPTFAEIAGVRPPSGTDGISMLPALLGKRQPRRGGDERRG